MKKVLVLLSAVLLIACSSPVFASEVDPHTFRPTRIFGAKDIVQDQPEDESETYSIPMGQVMPEVSYTTVDGETFDTAQILKDKKAILINFFQVSCPYCIQEFPVFNDLAKAYGDQVAFLALDSNMYDAPEDIAEVRDQNSITFPVAQETEWVLSDIIPYEGYPSTIVLDKNGALVFYRDYSISSVDELKEVFDAILAEDYASGFEKTDLFDSLEDDEEGSDANVQEETAAAEEPEKKEAATVDKGYKLVVKDQNGDPVANVMINFCSDKQQTCRMNATDANGELFFEVPEDTYHIKLLAAPDGYSYDESFEMYTKPHYSEPIDITINKK